MRRLIALVACVVIVACGFADAQRPLLAQSSTPQPQAAPPPPRPIRTEIVNYDSWSTTCQEFAEAKQKICAAAVQIAAQNGQVLFIWSMSSKDGRLTASFQTPTGVAIAPGLEMKSAKMARTIPFEACESGHCVATAAIDPALAKDLVASPTVSLSIHGSNGNIVKFDVPMKGADKAFAALQK